MKNKLSDLRNHLFEVIEMLKDDDMPIDVERAETINKIAGTIIESAKVEVKAIEVVGDIGDVTFWGQRQIEARQ